MEILSKIFVILIPLIAVIYFTRMYIKTRMGLSLAYSIGGGSTFNKCYFYYYKPLATNRIIQNDFYWIR